MMVGVQERGPSVTAVPAAALVEGQAALVQVYTSELMVEQRPRSPCIY
jgi:hypothetical protein